MLRFKETMNILTSQSLYQCLSECSYITSNYFADVFIAPFFAFCFFLFFFMVVIISLLFFIFHSAASSVAPMETKTKPINVWTINAMFRRNDEHFCQANLQCLSECSRYITLLLVFICFCVLLLLSSISYTFCHLHLSSLIPFSSYYVWNWN